VPAASTALTSSPNLEKSADKIDGAISFILYSPVVTGHWFLAPGSWLLITGSWLLTAGYLKKN
jgi:hypothetical protein